MKKKLNEIQKHKLAVSTLTNMLVFVYNAELKDVEWIFKLSHFSKDETPHTIKWLKQIEKLNKEMRKK
jgi:hypothetical protein